MIQYVGFVAAVLTTVSFVPQVYKVWTTNDTRSISLAMFLTFCAGVCAWLAYGIAKADWAITAANLTTLLLAGSILFKKITNLKHDKKAL